MGKKKEKSDLRISEDDAVLQRDVLVYTEEWYKNADDYTHYLRRENEWLKMRLKAMETREEIRDKRIRELEAMVVDLEGTIESQKSQLIKLGWQALLPTRERDENGRPKINLWDVNTLVDGMDKLFKDLDIDIN